MAATQVLSMRNWLAPVLATFSIAARSNWRQPALGGSVSFADREVCRSALDYIARLDSWRRGTQLLPALVVVARMHVGVRRMTCSQLTDPRLGSRLCECGWDSPPWMINDLDSAFHPLHCQRIHGVVDQWEHFDDINWPLRVSFLIEDFIDKTSYSLDIQSNKR